uniref:Retrotransposon gag domain-containing protein n=1 Tax=Periophthalmus magnuspinnatus TaxID=409849 RepID=A0A3B4AQM9_9GOBI
MAHYHHPQGVPGRPSAKSGPQGPFDAAFFFFSICTKMTTQFCIPWSAPVPAVTTERSGLNMDQADSGPDQSLRQACSHQGVIIGQHEQSIRTLLDFNQTLTQQVAQLTNQVAELLAAPSAVSGAPPRPPESRGTDPEPYSGQPSLCRGFLFQCMFLFQQCPTCFNSEASKIRYICGLLRGRALQWAEAQLANTPIDNMNFNDFISAFKLVFDRPHYQANAVSRLLSLDQVADYTIEFWTHTAEVDWTDSALRAAFLRGLNGHLKDELVSHDEPPDLHAPTGCGHVRERESSHRPNWSRAPPRLSPRKGGVRTLLSAEERRRRHRLAGACLYCDEHGHFVATCPARPKGGTDQ